MRRFLPSFLTRGAHSFLEKASLVLMGEVSSRLLSIVITVAISRYLGPSGKGIYTLAALVPAMLVLGSNVGIESANVYFIGKKKFPLRDMASVSFFFSFASGLTAIVLFQAVYGVLKPYFFQEVPAAIVFVMIIGVPFQLLQRYFSFTLLAMDRVRTMVAMNLFDPAARLALVLFTLYVLKAGLIGVVVVSVGMDAVTGLVTSMLVFRKVGPPSLFKLGIVKDMVSYGIRGYLANLFGFLMYRLDIWLLTYFVGVTAVGYYSVSTMLAQAVLFLPRSASTILFALVSRSGHETANNISARVCRLSLTVSAAASVSLALISTPLIGFLFGPPFLPSVVPLLVLLPGITILSVDSILSADLCGRGKPHVPMVISGIVVATGFGLNLLLIPRFGVVGASITASICYTLSASLTAFVFHGVSGVRIVSLLLPRFEDLKALYSSVSTKPE